MSVAEIEATPPRSTAAFLFRQDAGLIDAKTWWGGSFWLGGILVVLSGIGLMLAPYTKHDLATQPFLDWHVITAYSYLTIYVFALILIAICHYNLSAKRWRDRGKPAALAGLVPFFALLSGAAYWLHPQMGDEVPTWSVVTIYACFIVLFVWMIVELGFLPSKSRAP